MFKKKQEEKDIATVVDSEVVNFDEAPAWLREQATGGDGFEEVTSDDLVIPRISLLQPTAPPDIDYDSMPQFKPGMLINNVSQEILVDEWGKPLAIIPIKMSKSRNKFIPKKDGGGIACRSFDSITAEEAKGEDMESNATSICADCVFSKFDNAAGTKPSCQKFMNFMVVLPDHGRQRIGLSMKSTQLKVAKRILSTLVSTGRSMFAHKLEIMSIKDENDQGKFFNFAFRRAGFPTEEEFLHAKGIYDGLGGRRVVVDVENEVGDAGQTKDIPEDF